MFSRRLFLTAASAAFLCIPLSAESKADPINHDKQGIAIEGYDPVAYFTDGKPVKGDSKLKQEWAGSTWLFASAEHRDLFAQAPEKYAPQFGGYCAYAVSEGHTATIDPQAWKIVDGKLYLNYSLSVRENWLKDQTRRIEVANKNWPTLHR
jgi:YHS domain-containing protein